ncbi:methylated-DNA--[protein]-cysteine S-methyltransferase [Asticcacaulis sp. 201]|uniref:methylated-DNA--[protein]-cysteine S-methyltransferase n=1 Tax=Asticcacaulis sp. 201 TaxID=3028787 RepID=UPI002916CB95|nr:methylated-DNA--[protein]-cysteine S-methyltransferase [Asticcacaulis sp. 201]MDV6332920.1 methylated-DNA--[protein]-cysteine S-methyltransferase [Asticcacaulis sp. 201]
MAQYFSHIETPFGMAAAAVDEDGAVLEFTFLNGEMATHLAHKDRAEHAPNRLRHVTTQVHDFFERKRTDFTLVLRPQGTPFQQKVWQALCDIPFGETWSYQQIAKAVGDIKATQAVGGANNKNPIALIIPCHRVIGKSGALTGYGGGLPLKQKLLDFETPLLF